MYEVLKKKFGQNFLIDKNILKKITNLIYKKNLNIIEIGPGDGRLTDFILNYDPNELKIIEIDSDLIPNLEYKFGHLKNINIINKDILNYQIDYEADLIISNLPYNISSQVLVKICSINHIPPQLILMFQKEFAERLSDIKLNSINSLVNCFFDIKLSFNVSKNCFRPIPKIDSTVVMFTKKKNILLKKNEIKKFIEFKRSLFSHKRKTLNNLLKKYPFDKDEFDLDKRIEDISLEQLLKIFKKANP